MKEDGTFERCDCFVLSTFRHLQPGDSPPVEVPFYERAIVFASSANLSKAIEGAVYAIYKNKNTLAARRYLSVVTNEYFTNIQIPDEPTVLIIEDAVVTSGSDSVLTSILQRLTEPLYVISNLEQSQLSAALPKSYQYLKETKCQVLRL